MLQAEFSMNTVDTMAGLIPMAESIMIMAGMMERSNNRNSTTRPNLYKWLNKNKVDENLEL